MSEWFKMGLMALSDIFVRRTCICCHHDLFYKERFVCLACMVTLPTSRITNYCDNQLVRLFWGYATVNRGTVLFRYESESCIQTIIHKMKYGDSPELCQHMGRMLYGHFNKKGYFDDTDMILPVPLNPIRQKKRGYNQSEELAKGIAEYTGLPIDTKSVVRTVNNASQTNLSTFERQRNVENIFSIVHPDALDGKHLLIIDDVITTGATVKELIFSIHDFAPCASFSVLALARAGEKLYPDICSPNFDY